MCRSRNTIWAGGRFQIGPSGAGVDGNERGKMPMKAFSLFDDFMASEESIRREKEKARRLRRTAWWMRKIQKGKCYYCNRIVGRANLTMDHIVPLSRGGSSKKGNIVAACKECNNKKKSLLPVEWEDYLASLSGHKGSSGGS